MELNLTRQAAGYRQQHKRTSIWKKITMVLASVVVFCTTYALILPAITMEQDTICGLEEHTHEESCYTAAPSVAVTQLFCDRDTLALHSHDESCLDENDLPACGYADFVIHQHDAVCYDADGLLQCALPEIEAHAHGEGCWQPAHVHVETCYTAIQGELLCPETEGMPHAHGETCYTPRQNLICALPEVVGHAHSESCKTVTTTLVCKLTEEEAHAHDETCLDENGALACTKAETDGHVHDDACYEATETMTCTLPEQEGHSHGEGCYETVSDLTCQFSDTEPHVHADGCYQWTPQLTCEELTAEEGAQPTLICQLEEISAHTHDETCFTDDILTCGRTEVLAHVHQADDCYQVTIQESQQQVLSCGQEEHTHAETCYPVQEETDGDLSAGDSLTDIRYCGIAAHSHVEACYGADGTLMCTMTEHEHDWLCDLAPSDPTAVETREDWESDLPELTGDMASDLIAVAESQLGYEENEANYIITEDSELLYYSRYNHWWDETELYGDWNAKFVSFCLDYADIEFPLGEHPADWCEALWEANLTLPAGDSPIPGDLVFFDTGSDGSADRVGIITAVSEAEGEFDAILERRGMVQKVTYDLDDSDMVEVARIPGNEPMVELMDFSNVQNVINLIEAMPSADEIDEQMAVYEDAEDYEGLEAWYTTVVQQVKVAYQAYSMLTEEEKAQVTNADKLLELEYIWSATTLAVTTARPTIYQINSYVNSSSSAAVMVFGGTVAEKVTWPFLNWYAVKVEKDSSGYLRVIEILQPGVDKSNYKANNTGFVLLFEADTVIPNASVGNYVTVHFTIPTSGVYKSEGYGTVSFSTSPSGITSATPTKISSASTSEFVELNLYDYNGNVNENYWTKNNWYPGFQWNGGAYSNDSGDTDSNDYRYAYDYYGIGIPYAVTDRNRIDSIDFGNSLITNLRYGYGNYGDYTKSVNATNVTKVSSKYDESGTLNWIYGNSTEGYTNKPIGTSTTDISYYDAMSDTLVNGYPAMYDGTMLDYLFKPGAAVTKMNTGNIDGLFLYDEESGAYTFNSRENHAEYVTGENRFQLYDEIITPNFITYPFGNFLPLNTIDDPSKATQVSAFNYSGGMRNYVERLIADLKNDAEGLGDYWSSSQLQLATMLEEYKENWSVYGRTINSVWNTWENLSPANAIRDYFWGDTDGAGDKPSADTSFITPDFLSDMYNIDWDVQTNFFFGMEMKMRFYQPKGGMTGKDNNGDGNFDYPMVFEFTGDDDVWVYIDDVLFLDLSGIHRHVGGKIDFVNGKVYYYELVPSDKGDIKESAYAEFTFEEILADAGKDTSVLNSKGTFEDYSIHNFNFYYMERGSGSSVCRLNFNFPLLRQNTISVQKELTDDSDSITALGNPDFMFQILDVDSSGNKTNKSFFAQYDDAGAQWAYSLYDVDGSVIQEVKVTSRNADGTVKSLEVFNSEGKCVRKETQDADGNAVITNYPENGKVLTVDANGIFTLKAGQRAEFVGIPESWGKYYVRELLDNLDAELYDTVEVSGVAANRKDNIEINGTKFTGLESPILDMTNGSSTFRFNNKITTAELGRLEITKEMVVGDLPEEESVSLLDATAPEFSFEVKLDDVKIPAGTAYEVYSVKGDLLRTETVAQSAPGIIKIKAGEKALIKNILSGSKFEVTELGAADAGYTVTYQVDGGSSTSTGATGIIRQNSKVSVLVTNYTGAKVVNIPVTKNLAAADTTADHTFRFHLEQVKGPTDLTTEDMPSTTQVATNPIEIALANGVTEGSNGFILTYDGLVSAQLPAVYHYKITEESETGTNVIYDPTVYVVQVTVAVDGTAAITGMWKDGEAVDIGPAAFTNSITGSLTLSKQVVGTAPADGFTFEIALKDENGDPVTGIFNAVFYQQDGTKPEYSLDFGADGIYTLTNFNHGEKAVINGIPIGTAWTITETNADGYVVTYTVTQGEVNLSGEGSVANSTELDLTGIIVGSTEVVYTNTAMYELPETGGGGVAKILTCGGLLAIMPCLWLLRRQRYRGRRVTGG